MRNDKRETLNIRVKPEARELIDRAAKLVGKNRTDFVVAVGVGATVEAWFGLTGDGLVVKRAEFREEFVEQPKTIRWPSLDRRLGAGS